MSPPIQNDWWLAAALAGAALPAAMAQTAGDADGPPVGIVTSATSGAPVVDASTPIYVSNARGQRLSTGPDQTLHVLFSDQSAITLGPNSEVIVAEYRFDAATKEGSLLLDLSKGQLRVVGGFISKTNATTVRTADATVAIRGGISLVESANGAARATFLFGQSMTVTSPNSQTQTVTRPGFGVTVTGGVPSSPERMSPQQLTQSLNQFGANPGSGNPQPTSSSGVRSLDSPGGSVYGGGSINPGATLANDRLRSTQDAGQNQNIILSSTLRDILGSQNVAVS